MGLRAGENTEIRTGARAGGYGRINSLPEDKRAILDAMLLSEAKSVDEIIRIAREEWGVWKDGSPESIRRQLFRYKAAFVVPKQGAIAAKLSSSGEVQKLAAVNAAWTKSLDPLKEMEDLVLLQKGRVNKLLAMESQGRGKILGDTTRNMALLLEQLTRVASLQMDLGILKKVPQKVALSADVSDEQKKFVERAQLHQAEADATLEAVRHLREAGLLTVATEAPRALGEGETDAEVEEV